jgi:hypothetical protein
MSWHAWLTVGAAIISLPLLVTCFWLVDEAMWWRKTAETLWAELERRTGEDYTDRPHTPSRVYRDPA